MKTIYEGNGSFGDGRADGRAGRRTGSDMGGWTVGRSGIRAVGWSGERGVRAECWTVGRSDSWKEGDTGAGTFGQSDVREVGEQVNVTPFSNSLELL